MNAVEAIKEKIQLLPTSTHKELVEFIDDLLAKSTNGNQKQKALAWEEWANSHSQDVVILEDSREIIYEDK